MKHYNHEPGQDYPEGLELGISGTDTGAIMGYNKYKSAWEVWCKFVGEAREVEDNLSMFMGRALEGWAILNINQLIQYAKPFKDGQPTAPELRKQKDIVTTGMYWDDRRGYPRIAHVDSVMQDVHGNNILVEIKTSNQFTAWKTEVPHNYLYQILHYMDILNIDIAIILNLVGNMYTQYDVIHRKDYEKEIQAMIKAQHDFYETNVKTGKAPEAKKSDLDNLREKPQIGKKADLPYEEEQELLRLCQNYTGLNEVIKNKKTQLEDLKAQVIQKLDCSTSADLTGYTVKNTPYVSTSVDTGKMKKDGIYIKYLNEKPTTKLTIKKEGDG